NYYTKTNLQTGGQASVNWGNVINAPTTVAGYAISNFNFTAPTLNQVISYNGTAFANLTPNHFGSQTLTLANGQLTMTDGSNVTFTGWTRDTLNDLYMPGTQTVTGNKTFSGTLTANGSFVADMGVNAN